MTSPRRTGAGLVGREDALRILHHLFPRVVQDPGPDVPALETLNLELFVLQQHACDLIDRRADRPLRRCFVIVWELLRACDDEVMRAVGAHFMEPDLVFHPDLAWARERMPAFLAKAVDRLLEILEGHFGPIERDL